MSCSEDAVTRTLAVPYAERPKLPSTWKLLGEVIGPNGQPVRIASLPRRHGKFGHNGRPRKRRRG